jgi:hypothetical protein
MQVFAGFVKVAAGWCQQGRLRHWYSSVAVPGERGGVGAVKSADAVGLSYFNYDFAGED